MKHHDLEKMFKILNDYDTHLDMARISVYDAETGDAIFYALGFGGCDDDSGANSELAALLDKMSKTGNHADMQQLLEALPDKYSIEVEGIIIGE